MQQGAKIESFVKYLTGSVSDRDYTKVSAYDVQYNQAPTSPLIPKKS